MFREGHIYWARSGDARPWAGGESRRVRVECVRRSQGSGTFRVSDENRGLLGTRAEFTKRISDMGITMPDGERREAVLRLGDDHPGRDWWISDEEAAARKCM